MTATMNKAVVRLTVRLMIISRSESLTNHLALVQEGRTGKDIRVLDHKTFTVDLKENKL